MYANPAHIRKHPVKIRLNDIELRMLELMAEANQSQVAVIARELMLGGMNEDVLRIEASACQESA